MRGKRIKRLINLIAILIMTASAFVCGCKAAPLSEGVEEPEIKQEAVLPELPEEAEPSPSLSAPENTQAPSGSASTQAEVAAEFEFTPISETECSVTCTNRDTATYAEIPRTATIDGKEYTVTEIAEYAFYIYGENRSLSNLKTVQFPDSVRIINQHAFQHCEKLTSVNLAGVTELGYCAFQNCYSLTDTDLSRVQKLGGCAFSKCYKLPYADLSSVLTIGTQAFMDCGSLEWVYMPKLTEMDQVVFYRCVKLDEILIPQSAVSIGNAVFSGSKIQVKIAKGTNTEKWDKRWNDKNENQVVIYDYEVPAEYEFTPINETECNVRCTNNLIAVRADIPETAIIDGKTYAVTEIFDSGFSSADYLAQVQIPSSVKKIGTRAFASCPELSEVHLANVEEIGSSAFYRCPKLEEIIIPECVKVMGTSVFSFNDTQVKAEALNKPDGWDVNWNGDKDDPRTIINKNQNVIWGWFEGKAVLKYTPISETECSVTCTNIYSDVVTFAEVPEKAIIDGKEYTVTELGADCFYYATKLEKVVLPDTITSVKDMAVCYCPLITEISLPNAKYIREGAFAECSSLTNISLPKALCIEYMAFDGCESLQSVEIPSVQWIEPYAFADCFSLKEIVLPKSLTRVFGSVFDGNDTKVKVVKGTNRENWDENWNKDNKNQDVDYNYLLPARFEFEAISDTECRVDCINKEEAMQADIPATAVIDGTEYTVTDTTRAFYNCENLESVSLPYSVTRIGDYTFAYCANLTEISTVNVSEIGKRAFEYCTLVDELLVSGVRVIDDFAFSHCENITHVEISYAEELGRGVFSYCENLTAVELNYVSKIGSGTFLECSLSEVELIGVTEIGAGAFTGNTALKSIVIPATVEKMGNNVFGRGCDTQIKAVANEQPEGWDIIWNYGNANQNVIWGWFEGKAVFGYTPVEDTDNCAVYCLNKEEVTYAEIPSSAIIDGKIYTVTQIAEGGFSESSKLQMVILPYTVTDIGSNAFAECPELEEIVISAKVETMGENVFNGCIAKIYVYADEKPDGWANNWNGDDENIIWGWKDEAGRFAYTVISETECAVSLINKLTAVEAYIPAKVTIDGKEYSVTAIADGGFKGSALLKKVVMPYTLKYIGASAFADCFELESFSLYNAQTIGEGAFKNCKSLERLFVPKSVTFVGDNILSGTETAVYVRASSDGGWSENWNFGNDGEVEFDSKLILPVEIPHVNIEEQ